MPFWVLALLLIGTTLASYFMRPKLQSQQQKPASLGDFNFPTATEVRKMCVIVGRVLQKSPNDTWHGDLRSEPIYQKVPNTLTFGLTKKKVPTGQYKYYVGMQLQLAHGPDVRLREFLIGDKSVWTGDITSGQISFNLPELFGGEQQEGGYAGVFDYYGGSWSQTYNTYLDAQATASDPTAIVSHNRGGAYIMQYGPSFGNVAAGQPSGYVGNSANLKTYSFVLEKQYDQLGHTAWTVINDGDANPIEWAYEVLVNADYGMGVADGMIDLASFQTASHVCFNEGMGISVLWDTSRPCEDVLNDIIKLVDGACFVDRSTGLWTFKLARAADDPVIGYDPDTLPVFDNSVITSYESFDVNAPTETTNKVVVNYVDKSNGYVERPADFKELANRRIQGAEIEQPLSFYGVSDVTLAQRLAFRETRLFTANLRKATIKCNRKAHWLRPASVFKFADLSRGIESITMRVLKVDDGQLLQGEITVECIQDIFSLGSSKYNGIPLTQWVAPSQNAAAVASAQVFESPYYFSGNGYQVTTVARPAASTSIDYKFKVSQDGGPYASKDDNAPFTPSGTLLNNYSGLTSDIDTSDTLIVVPTNGMGDLAAAAAADIATGDNLIWFEDINEFAAFESFTINGSGQYVFHNVWRALLDTARQAHAAGSRVWFLSYGYAATEEDDFDNGAVLSIKHITRTLMSTISDGAATSFGITVAGRSFKPYVPGALTINGSYTAAGASGDITVSWKHRDRTQQDTIIRDTSTDIGPEPGVVYELKFYNDVSNTLLRTVSNITGNSSVYTAAQEATDNGGSITSRLRVELTAVRGTARSWVTAKRVINPRT